MNKKLMIVLVAGLCMIQISGCGNKNKPESTEVNESAVETSTADSDKVDSADIPELPPIEQEEEEDTLEFYEEADLACVLPNGFSAYDGEEGVYVYRTYPKDLSTISYVISEGDENITKMSKEEYVDMIEADFLDVYGDNVQIKINSYERIKVDRRDGLKVKLEYEFKGVEYEQLIYIIYNGDETHHLNFTQEKGAGWMDEFEETGNTISFQARN
ncbi:MAG: hypothetical protein HDR10_13145 [Lachnospiraceae bacterium]|nr:hypothetical protein [Lachnospiraceae bacterium]